MVVKAKALTPSTRAAAACPAIANVALGGGLEVAMACNARVVTKGAQLGLPELQLGAAVAGDVTVPRPLFHSTLTMSVPGVL